MEPHRSNEDSFHSLEILATQSLIECQRRKLQKTWGLTMTTLLATQLQRASLTTNNDNNEHLVSNKPVLHLRFCWISLLGFSTATDELITKKAAGWKVLEEQLGLRLCC